MVSFKKATKWLKEGKKVTRNCWNSDSYIFLDISDNIIKHNNGNELRMWIEILECTDWEIYEEDKTIEVQTQYEGGVEVGDEFICDKVERYLHKNKIYLTSKKEHEKRMRYVDDSTTLMIGNITDVLKQINDSPEYILFQDEYQIIRAKNGMATTIELTEKGKQVVDYLIKLGENELETKKCIELFGVKIYTTETEDDKSLSEKYSEYFNGFQLKDVKRAIKKLKDEFPLGKMKLYNQDRFHQIIDKIFGEKLTK